MPIIRLFLLTLFLMIGVLKTNAAQDEIPKTIITSAAWSPDGSRIVTGSNDGFLRIWDTVGQVLVDFTGVTHTIRSVDWSPDSSKIVSVGDDTQVRVWEADTGELLATMQGHEGIIQAVDWSPDGSKIASGSFRDALSLIVWNTNSYELENSRDAGNVYGVRWSPDGNQIAVAKDNGYTSIYNPKLEKMDTPLSNTDAVVSLNWMANSNKLVTGDVAGKVIIWDVSSGSQISAFQAHDDIVDVVLWNPDDRHLVTASRDGTIRFWDTKTDEVVSSLFIEDDLLLWSIAWSPDGTQLAYGGASGELHIIDVSLLETTPEAP